uniref:Probable magnesium transporter n=1 Tax=Opuntia streptacantha TaxID=393608 RepID=A0A7C8YRC2_OPUST
MAADNVKGLILAMGSSAFIGTSFILKKKGLRRAAAHGTRAGFGGHAYLLEPLWWAGMTTMFIGEAANFVAYVYAPAVLVTPLGALSIIISAVLAHFILKEKLSKLGVLGCVSCIVGSVVIVLHAPQEQSPTSVEEIWTLATQPAFMIYAAASLSAVAALVLHFDPRYGQSNLLVYLGICSLMGSLTVIILGCKYKGYWNCFKANFGRNKSTYLPTDLVFHDRWSSMCYYTIELPEQGTGYI